MLKIFLNAKTEIVKNDFYKNVSFYFFFKLDHNEIILLNISDNLPSFCIFLFCFDHISLNMYSIYVKVYKNFVKY